MPQKHTSRFITPALLLLIFANALVYCVKPPDYPDEPVIEYRRIAPTTLRQAAIVADPNLETTTVTIGYTDGDGDLGFNDTTSTIEVIDLRVLTPVPNNFTLPDIDHVGAGNGISGEIIITIPTTCCIPPPTPSGQLLPPCRPDLVPDFKRDSVVFQIRMRDRAGHWSNTITTEPVTLICTED
jgi:hypothetical protein